MHACGFEQGTGSEASPSQVSALSAVLLQLPLPDVGCQQALSWLSAPRTPRLPPGVCERPKQSLLSKLAPEKIFKHHS